MGLILLLLVLVLLFGGGGWYGFNTYGPHVGGGIGLFGVVIIILVVWLLLGRG